MTKDFLKEVFINKKRLLKLEEVKRICVPLYDELSVVKLWPMMRKDEEFMGSFPQKCRRVESLIESTSLTS